MTEVSCLRADVESWRRRCQRAEQALLEVQQVVRDVRDEMRRDGDARSPAWMRHLNRVLGAHDT